MKYIKKCKNCNKIIIFTDKTKFETQIYCSQECYHQYKRNHTKLIEKQCKCCNKTFKTYHKDKKYCCKKCSNKAMQKRINCTCDYCGVEFKRIESEVKKNKNHYCSKECKYASVYWDKHDIDILKKYYGKISLKEIQSMLHRTCSLDRIKSKSNSLGLYVGRKKWTNIEEKILKDNYSNKSFAEIKKMLPNRTESSILGKARSLGLLSKFYLENQYTQNEIDYIVENLEKTSIKNISNSLNRPEGGVKQKLNKIGYSLKKENNYEDLIACVRARLGTWKNKVRNDFNYTCSVTGGRSNIIVHHCRSFNLLFNETIEVLNFKIKKDFKDYSEQELDIFFKKFLEIQEYYSEYTCVTEPIHRLFHNNYGYGNNTIEQWNDFLEKYKNHIIQLS